MTEWCAEPLSDRDGFAAICTVPGGSPAMCSRADDPTMHDVAAPTAAFMAHHAAIGCDLTHAHAIAECRTPESYDTLDPERHCFRENGCPKHGPYPADAPNRCCCCGEAPEAHTGCDCE